MTRRAGAPLMHPRREPGLSPPDLAICILLILRDLLAGSTGLESAYADAPGGSRRSMRTSGRGAKADPRPPAGQTRSRAAKPRHFTPSHRVPPPCATRINPPACPEL